MPRSGKERKARRRERRRAQEAEADSPSNRPASLQGERGRDAQTDSANSEQRFPMQMLTESPEGDSVTMIELAVCAVGDGLRSTDPRIRNIAAKTALQMERINQADEHHADQMRLKEAILEQQGGHVDDSIPCGVVLLERPCTSVEEWQERMAEAEEEFAENGFPQLPDFSDADVVR